MKNNNNYSISSDVIKILTTERKRKHISQNKIYTDTGINIGRIERFKPDITILTLQRLCENIRIPISKVFLAIEKKGIGK